MNTLSQIASAEWDHVVVNISGGKDSSVLMKWALDRFPKDKLIFIHAVIDIDWKETVHTIRKQAKYFCVDVVFVQAVFADGSKKGFLNKLTAPRRDRVTGEIKQNQYPDMANRWCTSELKVAPIHKWIRNNLSGRILNLMGERAEESAQRARLAVVRKDEKLTRKDRQVWNASPLHEVTESEIWFEIKKHGIPIHPCYSWGVSRASCAICIFSSDREIRIAAKRAPEIVSKYMEAEKKVNHTFRYKAATKKNPEQKITIAQILKRRGGKK